MTQGRLIGKVLWKDQTPFHYGDYAGRTIGGKRCRIEYFTRTKVFVKDRQIGSDQIASWYLYTGHLSSIVRELDRPGR
jgi:hypothetical protein